MCFLKCFHSSTGQLVFTCACALETISPVCMRASGNCSSSFRHKTSVLALSAEKVLHLWYSMQGTSQETMSSSPTSGQSCPLSPGSRQWQSTYLAKISQGLVQIVSRSQH
uniref:Uncharacterized protein n=1 Tax=Micrurus lemniscatus lemniscatus TaxID=129467 RepID=A0A2D4J435_MICLE